MSAIQHLAVLNPYLWLLIAACIAAIAVGVRLEKRSAVALALLFGVPLELPLRANGDARLLLSRKARWLASFLRKRPQSPNTPGAHLAYGAIAVKRTLKELALRREKADPALAELVSRRKALVSRRNQASDRAFQSLVTGQASAVDHGRDGHAAGQELANVDAELLSRRLAIQGELVQTFCRAWDELAEKGEVPRDVHARARAEFEQPPGELPALLPLGLVRSPFVVALEYGMFFGRVAMALAFVATFQVSFLLAALLLFALSAYVVEPVVFKLQLSSLRLFMESPGHKLVDLKQYLERDLPPGAVFRLPITVPKFSSNPAWTNLNAIITAALGRVGATAKVTPFAMRRGDKQVRIELTGFADAAAEERARAVAKALATELEKNRAKFPLETAIDTEGGTVLLRLTDEDEKIWALIGEDASQAFIYLWRNLKSLEDTLTHLGPKFQPVFVFASNTEDPDVIEYELSEFKKLQAHSDREYGGQVGYLYLLRGGEWYSYNARLERFEEKDKIFAKAVPGFKERLADPAMPARERLLGALIRELEPKQLARVCNEALDDAELYKHFDGFDFAALPPHLRPGPDTLALLERRRAGAKLTDAEQLALNRELLFTALPMRVKGAFFKKVGNDIAVQELLVAGKTRPTAYTDRSLQEHVQDPTQPNFKRVWGDFARYTGLAGTTGEIEAAILRGADLELGSVPEVGAILDDKNEFAPGELEKGVATLLHPENRHVAIAVPRIDITLPEHHGHAVASKFILAAREARAAHNGQDALSRTAVFSASSPAYGKWLERPRPYLAHYARESLNAAHALSHDFQQSYLVAGAAGRLGGFTEALYGPTRFEVQAAPEPSAAAEMMPLGEVAPMARSTAPLGWSLRGALNRARARCAGALRVGGRAR